MLRGHNGKRRAADYSDETMHGARDVSIPNYDSAIVSSNRVVNSISGSRSEGY